MGHRADGRETVSLASVDNPLPPAKTCKLTMSRSSPITRASDCSPSVFSTSAMSPSATPLAQAHHVSHDLLDPRVSHKLLQPTHSLRFPNRTLVVHDARQTMQIPRHRTARIPHDDGQQRTPSLRDSKLDMASCNSIQIRTRHIAGGCLEPQSRRVTRHAKLASRLIAVNRSQLMCHTKLRV